MNKIIVYTLMVMAAACAIADSVHCAGKADGNFVYDSKGRRDPFAPLVGQERSSGTGLESVASFDDLKLEGIAVGAGGRQVAIINGQMVKEKDKFGSLSIKKISRKTVELSIENRDYTLTLQEPEKENAPGKK
jgi:hypothetical protein